MCNASFHINTTVGDFTTRTPLAKPDAVVFGHSVNLHILNSLLDIVVLYMVLHLRIL